MPVIVRVLHFVVLSSLLSYAFAQNAPPTPQTKLASLPISKSQHVKLPPPKLTDKEKQGLRLIDSALTEATALSPDMRAFVEWRAANGLAKYDAKRSLALLESAFTSATEIGSPSSTQEKCFSDPHCRIMQILQLSILRDLIKMSPEKASELALKVDSFTKARIESSLLDQYIEKKQLDRAKALLDEQAGSDDYPYYAAGSLMDAIPDTRRDERIAIFAQALNNFQQTATEMEPDPYDFAALLVRFWRQLPPAMAMDAVDSILHKTKDYEEASPKLPMAITTSTKGMLNFSSIYELRLFELMPIIRELDSAHAEALLREHAEVRNSILEHPNGLNSLDDKFDKPLDPKDDSIPAIIDMGRVYDAPMQTDQAYILQEEARIQDLADRNPKQALAEVYTLPELNQSGSHPRMNLFYLVAERTINKDPSVCRTALSEIRKSVSSLKPESQALELLHVADLYIQLHAQEDVVETLHETLKVIDDLYDKDSDLKDPNLAFKGTWPSTQFWGRCVTIAARISPQLVEEIISQIQDPEILSYEKVMYANGLLGAPHIDLQVAQNHKDSDHFFSAR